MKSLLTTLAALVVSSAAVAGPISMKSPKAPVMPPPPPSGCDCFAPGFAFGAFGGAILPDHGDDNFGGGILGEYAFSPYVALQGSYGVFATNPAHHDLNAYLVLRYPITSICVAPYILAGGGYSTNSVNGGHVSVGGGLEARIQSAGCMGIFADGIYNFAEDSVGDYTIVRLGVKFPF